MHVLLVEPAYYTRFPPLGLLKLSSYHKARGHTVELVRGLRQPEMPPDLICVTSLFTYSWSPVHEVVSRYRSLFPRARVQVGGIYASLMPEHAGSTGAEIHTGLLPEAEDFAPDYSLVPSWDASILFSSRGCVRRCAFCSVPKIEPDFHCQPSIAGLVEPAHRRIVLWDNNFLASPFAPDILDELADMGKTVDFNQGLDARLLTPALAEKLARVRQRLLRIAYDTPGEGKVAQRAIEYLAEAGISKKKIVVYVLFNFRDSPDDFLRRIHDLMSWDVTAYPMRFEPLNSLKKNQHVGSKWTAEQLEMIADARRVLGWAGAWPPTEGLKRKFLEARSFENAMSLREKARPQLAAKPSINSATRAAQRRHPSSVLESAAGGGAV